jgi:hypothetical protein
VGAVKVYLSVAVSGLRLSVHFSTYILIFEQFHFKDDFLKAVNDPLYKNICPPAETELLLFIDPGTPARSHGSPLLYHYYQKS